MPQLIATLRDVTEGRRADGTVTCGSLTTDEAMPRDQAETTAALLKAVADPVRLQLLSLIKSAKAQEACVCDLTPAVGLSQPTVSHHLKVLTEAGLLTRERRGTWAWFSAGAGSARRPGRDLRLTPTRRRAPGVRRRACAQQSVSSMSSTADFSVESTSRSQ